MEPAKYEGDHVLSRSCTESVTHQAGRLSTEEGSLHALRSYRCAHAHTCKTPALAHHTHVNPFAGRSSMEAGSGKGCGGGGMPAMASSSTTSSSASRRSRGTPVPCTHRRVRVCACVHVCVCVCVSKCQCAACMPPRKQGMSPTYTHEKARPARSCA